MTTYQVMPPLADDELTALRADIAERGVLVPIVRDQHGNLLDGHHRAQIANELGITYRVDTVRVADEQDARSIARAYNMARRHLTRAQKRALIADEIQSNPDRSDREIGRLLGVDHKTVGSVRHELSGEFPQRHERKEFHPIGQTLLPLTLDGSDGEVVKSIAEAIRERGFYGDITLAPDGRILDGRLRYHACIEANVRPSYRRLGEHYSEVMLIDYWVSMNLLRSHLNKDQRAMLAVEYEERFLAAGGAS